MYCTESLKKRKSSILLILLTLSFTAFIFIHSARPASLSAQDSGQALGIIQMILQKIGADFTLTEHIIRKTAHFLEFFVLGLLLTLSFFSIRRNVCKNLIWPLYLSLVIALSDETIQYFSQGRSPEVKDILLDYSGAITAIIIVSLLLKNYLRKHGDKS